MKETYSEEKITSLVFLISFGIFLAIQIHSTLGTFKKEKLLNKK